jgi:DNA repair protein RecO
MPRLTHSDIIHSFESIRNALKCFLRTTEVVELTLNFVPERDASLRVYELLKSTLYALENDCKSPLLVMFYKIKLLEIVGYLPKLDCCGRCGNKGDAFYISQGTVLCKGCSGTTGSAFELSRGAINFYSNIQKWIPSKINRIKAPEGLVEELSLLIDNHMKYILQRDLRTADFQIAKPM